MKYYKIIVADLSGENCLAYQDKWRIYIDQEYADCSDLIEHEKEHVKQWFCLPLFHHFLYVHSIKYRIWSEKKAHKRQLKVAVRCGVGRKRAIGSLAKGMATYDKSFNEIDAKQYLRKIKV